MAIYRLSRRRFAARMFSWKESGFFRFSVFSLIGHAFLILTLALVVPPGRSLEDGVSRLGEDAIESLTTRLNRKLDPEQSQIPGLVSENASSAFKRALEDMQFDDDVSEADRGALAESMLDSAYRVMINASHASLSESHLDGLGDEIVQQAGGTSASKALLEIVRQGPGGGYAVHKIKSNIAALIDRMEEMPGSGSVMTMAGGQTVLVPAGQGPKEVPSEYYFRASPFRKMAAVRAGLFASISELADPLSSGRESPRPEGRIAGRIMTDRLPEGPSTGVVFISTRMARVDTALGERRPLELGRPDVAEILDRLMALGVEEQLRVFKKEFLDRYDWESPGLALLTREFIFNNLNGVFFVLDDLAGAFDQAEELFYKRPAYDFFKSIAGRFPGTRTDSEIGFYLVSGLDCELRTIRRILAAREEFRAVLKGERKPASMFRAEAKALILGQIHRDLLQRLENFGMSVEMMMEWYLQREQGALAALAERGRETRNRALVQWGGLLWREEDYDGALAKWKMVEMNVPGYSRSFGQIMEIIDRYGALGQARRAIEGKLLSEDAAGRADLLNRHLRFHTWERRSASSQAYSRIDQRHLDTP